MNADPIPAELEKVFNVGTGLSNLDERSLEHLSELIAQVDSLFGMFSEKYTFFDLLGNDPYNSTSMSTLINTMMMEEGIVYDPDNISHGYLVLFGYGMIASYYIWASGDNRELDDQRNLTTFVFKTPHSRQVIETNLVGILNSLGVTENIYQYIFYLSDYIYRKFKEQYPSPKN